MDRLLEATGFYGFRWWRFEANGELRSPLRTFVRWAPGMNTARCLASRRLLPWRAEENNHFDGAPSGHCTCGIYGLHDVPEERSSPAIAQTWWHATSGSGGRDGLVLGVVEGWGRSAVGPHWWRTEFARVRALYGPTPSAAKALRRAGRRYGVPVYRDLEALIGEWRPQPVLADVA
jgi:hypothetical protein